MKRKSVPNPLVVFISAVLSLTVLAVVVFGQSGFSTVTGTVKDPAGNPYMNCTWSAQLINQTSPPKVLTLNGYQLNQTVYNGSCDSTGTFTVALPANDQLQPANQSQWTFSVASICPAGTTPGTTAPPAFTVTLAVTGSSMNITTQLQAAAPLLQAYCRSGGGGANAADQIRYVSPYGSDTFDGLSWGTAKATEAAACSSLTSGTATCSGGHGTIFISPSYTGPWVNRPLNVNIDVQTLSSQHVVDVRTFGAVGDGVTNDGAAIQNAINALCVGAGNPGGTLYFPPTAANDYYVGSTTIDMSTCENFEILGGGKHGNEQFGRAAQTRITGAGFGSGPVLKIGGSLDRQATIENIAVDGCSLCIYASGDPNLIDWKNTSATAIFDPAFSPSGTPSTPFSAALEIDGNALWEYFTGGTFSMSGDSQGISVASCSQNAGNTTSTCTTTASTDFTTQSIFGFVQQGLNAPTGTNYGFNGFFKVTWTSATTFTYANTSAGASSTMTGGGILFWPMTPSVVARQNDNTTGIILWDFDKTQFAYGGVEYYMDPASTCVGCTVGDLTMRNAVLENGATPLVYFVNNRTSDATATTVHILNSQAADQPNINLPPTGVNIFNIPLVGTQSLAGKIMAVTNLIVENSLGASQQTVAQSFDADGSFTNFTGNNPYGGGVLDSSGNLTDAQWYRTAEGWDAVASSSSGGAFTPSFTLDKALTGAVLRAVQPGCDNASWAVNGLGSLFYQGTCTGTNLSWETNFGRTSANELGLNAPVAAPTGLTLTATTGGTLANGTYYCKVSSAPATIDPQNSFEESQGSTEQSVTLTGGNDAIAASWTGAVQAPQYAIYCGTSSGGENLRIAHVTATSYTVTALTGGNISPNPYSGLFEPSLFIGNGFNGFSFASSTGTTKGTFTGSFAADRTYTMPDQSGTVCLTSTCASAGTAQAMVTPAGARNTSVGVEGAPNPCQWYRAAEITNCHVAMTLNVGDHVFVAYFNQATSCSISDSYGNTWTLDANVDTNSDRLFETTVTAGGSSDQIISSSGCLSGTGYVVSMVVFRTAGETGVDNTANIVGFGPDTCGVYSIRCTSTVTTTSAADAIIFVSAIQASGSGNFIGQGVSINPPMNVVSTNQDENNGPIVAITGEQFSGNYTFTYNTGSAATGGGGGAFGFLIPMKSAPTIYGSHASTQIVPSTNPSLSITVSIGQSWLAGGMTNGIDWTVAGCGNASLVDGLGNVWTPHLSIEGDTHGIIWTLTVTAAGSDTISPPSACGLASSIRGGLFYATQIAGNFAIDTFHEGDDTTVTSDVRNPYDYVVAAETDWNTGGSTFRLSSPLTQIEAQNTPTATYPGTVEAGLFPTAQQYSVTSILNGIVQIVTFLGSGPPSLPAAPRKLNPYDMSVPQLQAAQIVTPIPATGCNGGPCLLYRGDLSNSFQVTLTENIASSDYGSFVDGTLYTFNICENATGGWTLAWTSNGTTVAYNAPTINTAANACGTYTATWNAAARKLYFLTPPPTASGQIVIATATSGSHTFTTPFATAPTCTAVLDGTTPPATALSYAASATTTAVTVTLSASGSGTFDVHCTSLVGNW